ncbi:FecR family protein [Azomonas macrocytogenes]|uniref:Transmembrane sensor n=1 Tax=Azomonas macrocytogenes TaxID=69962 RepID=A0A839T6U0_AZOMA|nr:FecR family protein [Azomonas macrocytogenes]MBB3104560.1 transmembrane sensor [Azomonas macrocytogenes]
MTSRNKAPLTNDSIIDEAAHWCMRLHSGECTDQERKEFDHWLKSSPVHAREYKAMQEIWFFSERLPRKAQRPNALPSYQRPLTRTLCSRLRPSLAMASTILVTLFVGGWFGWQKDLVPNWYQHFSTSNVVQRVELVDGSQVELNLNTAFTYLNFRQHRSVTLTDGEAFFKVNKDMSRPFIVKAGKGSITVTGTQFNVWKYADQVIVTLTEGSVKVMNDADGAKQAAMLSPGMQARYASSMPHISVQFVDTESALAWRDGKLILNNLTLVEALPLINQYLDKPVLLGDSAPVNSRIGGIYNTRNISDLVHALPRVLPISLSQNTEGNVIINGK